MSTTRIVTLIGKPGCHLCDDARTVLTEVLASMRDTGVSIRLHEQNILEDDSLRQQYAEEIPVVLIDGRMHSYWTVDPVRFRAALEELK